MQELLPVIKAIIAVDFERATLPDQDLTALAPSILAMNMVYQHGILHLLGQAEKLLMLTAKLATPSEVGFGDLEGLDFFPTSPIDN
jgi:hypothetical protein